MPTRYFELTDDLTVPERWDLDTPTDARGQVLGDALFTAGEPVTCEAPLYLPLRAYDGVALDFTEAGFGVPVVSARLAAVFSAGAARDIQLVPAEVESHPEPCFVLVCTRRVEGGVETARREGAHVFRARGWETLLVSEELKRALEDVGGKGLRFWEIVITGDSALEQARGEAGRRREQAGAARTAFWATLGAEDAQARIPGGGHGGWPGRRQGWRVLRRAAGRTLLVTDGLSDPPPEHAAPSVGFGLELALETDTELKEVHKSWPTQLLQRVGEELVRSAPVREAARSGLCSLDVSGKRMPTSLVTQEGRVGVMLGVTSPALPEHFTLPEGEVRLITVKALLPAELLYAREHGAEGHERLARQFAHGGEEHLSRARRRSVVSLLR